MLHQIATLMICKTKNGLSNHFLNLGYLLGGFKSPFGAIIVVIGADRQYFGGMSMMVCCSSSGID